jgi:hypothetical protein
MEESHKICDRCGKLILVFSPNLLTVMKLQKTPREQHNLYNRKYNKSCGKRLSNFCVKCDKHPADYGAIFEFSDY